MREECAVVDFAVPDVPFVHVVGCGTTLRTRGDVVGHTLIVIRRGRKPCAAVPTAAACVRYVVCAARDAIFVLTWVELDISSVCDCHTSVFFRESDGEDAARHTRVARVR